MSWHLRRWACLLASSALLAMGASWPDPVGDLLPDWVTPPEFDLVSVETTLEPGFFTISLAFDPLTASPTALKQLTAYIDIDVDQNPATGYPSHIESFWIEPIPPLGAEYYIAIEAFETTAPLVVYASGGVEQTIGRYPVVIDGSTATVTVPRCPKGTDDGICMEARYDMCILVGNGNGPTDRIPNGTVPISGEPVPADFDEDGDVDRDDASFFRTCTTGPRVGPPSTGCQVADFDQDQDVDQHDFAAFQLMVTGAG